MVVERRGNLEEKAIGLHMEETRRKVQAESLGDDMTHSCQRISFALSVQFSTPC